MSTSVSVDRSTRDKQPLLARLLHPIVIVGVSLLVAGGVLLTGAELAAITADGFVIMKLLAGTVLLVLLAYFFEQRFRHDQRRAEVDRHFRAASNELERMRLAVGEARKQAAEPDTSRAVAATAAERAVLGSEATRASGSESAELASLLIDLADVRAAAGDLVEATEALSRALAINRRVFGDHHGETAKTRARLGNVLQARGDFVGAAEAFAGAREDLERLVSRYDDPAR